MIAFDRLFNPSAFEAVRTIRSFRSRQPNLSSTELFDVIKILSPDSHDYHAGFQLDEIVPASTDHRTAPLFYQCCIESLVARNPIWIRLLSLGRLKFIQKLSPDQQNCFFFAGLMADPPDARIMDWWYGTVSTLRQVGDLEKMKRAREAELLSLKHEVNRLTAIGINRKPVWVAFDDNTAGYDILSYDRAEPHPVNRLIEVKSTIASPLRFFVTRNEWNTALKFSSRYFFHIWDLRGPTLYERSAQDILPKIPSDNANGRWSNAEIPI